MILNLLAAVAVAGSNLGVVALTPAPNVPQTPRDTWKDCYYNDSLIRCRDEALKDGLRILWVDGLRNTYTLLPPRSSGMPAYLRDRYGGVWRREVLPQGNSVLTNLSNGNRIMVPLRFPCKPPLKGEVGYCHE
jgi:hypothetical protein